MTCENGCEFGWLTVQPGYAERWVPDPDPSVVTPENMPAAVALVEARRAGLRGTVYPCKVCNKEAFFRWAGGHFVSGHDEQPCNDPNCQRARHGHRRSGSGSLSGLEPSPAADPPGYIEAIRRDLE